MQGGSCAWVDIAAGWGPVLERALLRLRSLLLGVDAGLHHALIGGETPREPEVPRPVQSQGIVDAVEDAEIGLDVVPMVKYPGELGDPLDYAFGASSAPKTSWAAISQICWNWAGVRPSCSSSAWYPSVPMSRSRR